MGKAGKGRVVQGTYIRSKVKEFLIKRAEEDQMTVTRLASELLEKAVSQLEKEKGDS